MGIYKSKKNRTLSKLSKKKTIKRNSRKSFSRKMRDGGGGLVRTLSGRIVYSPNSTIFTTAARNLMKPPVISFNPLNPLNPVNAARAANRMAKAAQTQKAPKKSI